MGSGDDTETSDPEAGAPSVDIGAQMGRYQLRSVIGAGGMGVVFDALDPELDRTVAVKILRTSGGADGERRLRREGQTMARLTHPNVLRIYDVGVDHGHVFVAMEHVSGGTLGDWLDRAPRTPAEIVEAFVQAGRGLAAAHDAGLVHLDFKPSNVLVGTDGRVLVTDFGLARVTDAAPAPAVEGAPAGATATRVGGTPAYMAPEQHAGAAIDARADQFSFCVAMWRALYGAPPFAGDARSLAAATAAGVLTPPPTDAAAKVPARLHAALERGLRADPAQRFPSMRELLAELAPAPPRDRRWMIVAAVAVLVIGGGAVWTLRRPERARGRLADVCAVDRDRFAEVWNPKIAATLQASFRATHAPFADALFAEIARVLDGRAVAWEAMRRDSCEDTRVRREQSDPMMDLRSACLDRRLLEIETTITALEHADATALGDVSKSIGAVGDVAACGEVEALARRAPLPADPAHRQAIAAVDREVAAARAETTAGHYGEVASRRDALIAHAKATGYAPVIADAELAIAPALALMDQSAPAATLLDQASLDAEAGGDDALRFDCEVQEVRILGYYLERYDDAVTHAQRADALLTRLGPDRHRAATLALARAQAEWIHGAYPEGIEHANQAIALFEQLDPRSVDLASAIHVLGILYEESGDPEHCIETEDRALAIAEAALGPDHPLVANIVDTRAGGHRRLDHYDVARAGYQRALAIRTKVYGPDSKLVATALFNLSAVDVQQGKLEDAIAVMRKAQVVIEKVSGPDSSDAGLANEQLGSTLSKAGHYDEAETLISRAVEIHRERIGPDSPQAASSSKVLGDHFMRSKQPAKALAAYREAIRGFRASQGPDTKMVRKSLIGVGDAEVALGHPAAAIPAYEGAIAVMTPEDNLRADVEAKLAALRSRRR